MEKELKIPENVKVEVQNKHVKISGPKGESSREFKYFLDIKIEKKDNKIVVTSGSDIKKVRVIVGTIIAHMDNMIKGVTEGYTYKMKVIYSHFPINVKVEGSEVQVHNFLGEKVPRIAKIVGNTKVEVKGQDLILTGPNKEDVGQTCGNIEQTCRITKYDRRIFQDGIYKVEGD